MAAAFCTVSQRGVVSVIDSALVRLSWPRAVLAGPNEGFDVTQGKESLAGGRAATRELPTVREIANSFLRSTERPCNGVDSEKLIHMSFLLLSYQYLASDTIAI